MSDLIRRSDAFDAVDNYDGAYIADMLITDIPAVDAVEVRHGRWIECEIFTVKGNVDMLQSARCPKCWRYHTTPYSYNFTNYSFCPNCGAKMDGEDGDGDG